MKMHLQISYFRKQLKLLIQNLIVYSPNSFTHENTNIFI